MLWEVKWFLPYSGQNSKWTGCKDIGIKVIPACIIFMVAGSIGETETSERDAAEMRSFRQEASPLALSRTDACPLPQRLKQPVAKLYGLQWEIKSIISLSMTMSKG